MEQEWTVNDMRIIDISKIKCRICFPRREEPFYYALWDDIQKAPIIDAVQVVRCGQCIHWKAEDEHCMNLAGLCATGKKARENYCSFGERKVDA